MALGKSGQACFPAAKHLAKAAGEVSEHSSLHTAFTIAGLLLSAGLLAYVVRLAHRALAGVA